uniref:Uncharacterized protein n=1 Tax=Tanacetum cinerariifolium TaxID=118510 RepID=A0A699GH44_TANCI|nr:hypothetical protein [Tanacetum cinerariifolium]
MRQPSVGQGQQRGRQVEGQVHGTGHAESLARSMLAHGGATTARAVLPSCWRHEYSPLPAYRPDLGYHLDCHYLSARRGAGPGVDRVPLLDCRRGFAGRPGDRAARLVAAAPGVAVPVRPGHRPVLPELPVLLLCGALHHQRPGSRGVFHRAAVDRAGRPPVPGPADPAAGDGGRRSGPGRHRAAVCAANDGPLGRQPRAAGTGPVAGRHLVLRLRQPAVVPHAVAGADTRAHQCLGHADRRHHAGRRRLGAGHAVRARPVAALPGRAAVPGYTRLGDRLYGIPDAGRAHRSRSGGVFHGIIPHRCVDDIDHLRRLPMDAAGAVRAGAGAAREYGSHRPGRQDDDAGPGRRPYASAIGRQPPAQLQPRLRGADGAAVPGPYSILHRPRRGCRQSRSQALAGGGQLVPARHAARRRGHQRGHARRPQHRPAYIGALVVRPLGAAQQQRHRHGRHHRYNAGPGRRQDRPRQRRPRHRTAGRRRAGHGHEPAAAADRGGEPGGVQQGAGGAAPAGHHVVPGRLYRSRNHDRVHRPATARQADCARPLCRADRPRQGRHAAQRRGRPAQTAKTVRPGSDQSCAVAAGAPRQAVHGRRDLGARVHRRHAGTVPRKQGHGTGARLAAGRQYRPGHVPVAGGAAHHAGLAGQGPDRSACARGRRPRRARHARRHRLAAQHACRQGRAAGAGARRDRGPRRLSALRPARCDAGAVVPVGQAGAGHAGRARALHGTGALRAGGAAIGAAGRRRAHRLRQRLAGGPARPVVRPQGGRDPHGRARCRAGIRGPAGHRPRPAARGRAAGDYPQRRLHAAPGKADRLAGNGQAGRPDRPGPQFLHHPRRGHCQHPGAAHRCGRQDRVSGRRAVMRRHRAGGGLDYQVQSHAESAVAAVARRALHAGAAGRARRPSLVRGRPLPGGSGQRIALPGHAQGTGRPSRRRRRPRAGRMVGYLEAKAAPVLRARLKRDGYEGQLTTCDAEAGDDKTGHGDTGCAPVRCTVAGRRYGSGDGSTGGSGTSGSSTGTSGSGGASSTGTGASADTDYSLQRTRAAACHHGQRRTGGRCRSAGAGRAECGRHPLRRAAHAGQAAIDHPR